MKRPWIVVLFCLISTAPASAQFTTFIAPPTPVKDSIKAAAAAGQRSVADSITHAQITAMKTWVDSAAGVPAVVVRPGDTTHLQDTTPVRATVVSNGAVAPETASQLPLLLAFGGGAMLLGIALLWRPRSAVRRIDR